VKRISQDLSEHKSKRYAGCLDESTASSMNSSAGLWPRLTKGRRMCAVAG